MALARRILGDTAPAADVTALAERMRAFALAAPPLSAEQRDTITTLLRP